MEVRGYGLTFPRSKLRPESAHELAATVKRVIADPSFRANAQRRGQLLRAFPRTPVQHAAGGQAGPRGEQGLQWEGA